MSAAETVKVTIDGREVEVAKGTGLVETALAAGIEIPVFCYEPRLGPPIGACRMCLVEVEGMPKLQAGCTLTATDGMVVRTAQTSPHAAEGQSSTLEFILVNHPLDCPVCDKGGECPLQDLTFRWGPPVTRNTFPKRTFEKPIPISPTIALDRERCILCYRCTRFSSDVAEDSQLVARDRGAQSIIATFEDEPYRAPFSGNVIELCPVGALTSTQYRFEARPWEIQDVPTVCGLCPVGCNVDATTREGKVKRVVSRNHPEVDEGWLCDKGRFGFTHLRADDRIVDPGRRAGHRRYETLSWDDALDEAESMLRAAGSSIVTALSGSETGEEAYALAKLLRQGLDAHCAVMPEDVGPALDAFRLPLSAIRDAELIVVLGDDPVVERAPIVDLWLKAARRAGAEIVDTDLGAADGGVSLVRDELSGRIRELDRTVLIWSGPEGAGGETVAALAGELGLSGRSRAAAPSTCSTPRTAEASPTPGRPRPTAIRSYPGADRAPRSCRATKPPRTPTCARSPSEPERCSRSRFSAHPVAGFNDLVLPGASYLERDGTYMNLEGRASAPSPGRGSRPCPDELTWIAKLAERFDVAVSPYPVTDVRRALSSAATEEIDYPPRSGSMPRSRLEPDRGFCGSPAGGAKPRSGGSQGLRLLTYRPLFSGPGHCPDPRAPVPASGTGDRALRRGRRQRSASRPADAAQRRLERNLGGAVRARETRNSSPASRGSPCTRRSSAPTWRSADAGLHWVTAGEGRA